MKPKKANDIKPKKAFKKLPVLFFFQFQKKGKMITGMSNFFRIQAVLLVSFIGLSQLSFVNGLATCRIKVFTPQTGLCKGTSLTNNYCVGESTLFSSAPSSDRILAMQSEVEAFTRDTCTLDITESCRSLSGSPSVAVIFQHHCCVGQEFIWNLFLFWDYGIFIL